MPVLPFAHLALYRFCNLTLFQVFLENPFLIMAFCTILCQSYILVPFLNGFYTPLLLSGCLLHQVSLKTEYISVHSNFIGLVCGCYIREFIACIQGTLYREVQLYSCYHQICRSVYAWNRELYNLSLNSTRLINQFESYAT